MNLALDAWIPALMKDGSRRLIAPWEIGDAKEVNSLRPPWNGAITEFLIALYQTVLLPEDAGAWRKGWEEPPSPDYLKRELSKVSKYFGLFGEKPFLQDPSLMDPKFDKPAQKLLVDGVSENQEKKNADLFVQSGKISAFCLPCAAAALWDLQAHAPQGSAGYYTSLRGGGPISTLLLSDTLWKTVWANVIEQGSLGLKGRPDPGAFFPWMKPESRKVKSADEHPLHVYWGMPRRVLLRPENIHTFCDTCGAEVDQAITSFRSGRGGFQYSETDWKHPLSPYVRTKEGGWVVRSTEGDLAGYRHWVGVLVDTPQGDGVPAFVIKRWFERGLDLPLRIWGYGWKCDQAAVTVWCEGRMPILASSHRKELEKLAITLVMLSQRGAEALSDSLHWAAKSSGAGPVPSQEAVQNLWRSTEVEFLSELKSATADPSKEHLDTIKDRWVGFISHQALMLYEKHLPVRRIKIEWLSRQAHKLSRRLSDRNPMTLKTRKYGDYKLKEA